MGLGGAIMMGFLMPFMEPSRLDNLSLPFLILQVSHRPRIHHIRKSRLGQNLQRLSLPIFQLYITVKQITVMAFTVYMGYEKGAA